MPDKRWFIQYGKKPVKFIAYTPKNAPAFHFLVDARWRIIRQTKTFATGHTKKPIDISRLWRAYENRTT